MRGRSYKGMKMQGEEISSRGEDLSLADRLHFKRRGVLRRKTFDFRRFGSNGSGRCGSDNEGVGARVFFTATGLGV